MAMTVQELHQRLGNLPGEVFKLPAADLGIEAVQRLFEDYLAGSTLMLSKAKADVSALQVTGSLLLGSSAFAALARFVTDPGGKAVAGLELRLAMPDWKIQTGFLSLSADYLKSFGCKALYLLLLAVPDEDGTVEPGLGVAADFPFQSTTIILAGRLPGTSGVLDALGRPYTVAARFEELKLSGLKDLAAFAKVDAFPTLPAALMENLRLVEAKVSISQQLGLPTVASLDVKLVDTWDLLPGLFRLEDVHASFSATFPLSSPNVFGSLYGRLQVTDKLKVRARLVLPDLDLEAELLESFPLEGLLDRYLPGVPLPLDVEEAHFSCNAKTQGYRIGIEIEGDLPLVGSLKLTDLSLEVAGQGKGKPSGRLAAVLAIGGAHLLLGGEYDANAGWKLFGSTVGDKELKIGALLNALAKELGIELPDAVGQITLRKIALELTTGKVKTFRFVCFGSFPLAETAAAAEIEIEISQNEQKKWTYKLGGKLVLEVPGKTTSSRKRGRAAASLKRIELSLFFERNVMKARWEGQGTLAPADILRALKLEPPEVPPALDLALKGASFSYDFTAGSLVLAAASKHHGKAVLVSAKENGTRRFAFLLAVDKALHLKDLPLVGSNLPELVSLGLEKLQVLLASGPLSASTAKALNALISGKEDPRLPDTGTSGKVSLTADLRAGEARYPISVSLGGKKALRQMAASGTDDGGQWLNLQKKIGPLSVQRAGVRFQDGRLFLMLDTELTVGGLAIAFEGLAVSSPLTDFSPQLHIGGLGLSYTAEPLQLGAGFLCLSEAELKQMSQTLGRPVTQAFGGGIQVRAPKAGLAGLGFFANVQDAPSLFLYAQVEGAFGGPPYFFVTGFAGGFGLHSRLVLPEPDELHEFPFLTAMSGKRASPAGMFAALNGKKAWLRPAPGEFWLAAGIQFTSFKLIEARALAVAKLGTSLELALMGSASTSLPAAGPRFAHVELLFQAVVKPLAGFVGLAAMVSPRSYLLAESCRLTGGMVFNAWLSGSDRAGDFVLTLGGYHPAFQPPAHYPKVTALGFNWPVSSKVSASGGVYFAVTPSCLMAGGRLAVLYQDGGLQAWLTASFHLVQPWVPLTYKLAAAVTVGVSYEVSFFGVKKTYGVEVAATLELEGPPTRGQVKVDCWLFSFTVPIGDARPAPPPAITWPDVRRFLPERDADLTKITIQTGLLSQVREDDQDVWVVAADGFTFATESAVPASTVEAAGTISGKPVNVSPLGWSGLVSRQLVQVVRVGVGGNLLDKSWRSEPLARNLPKALWGAPGAAKVEPGAELLPDCLAGAVTSAPAPALGTSRGTIDVARHLGFTEVPSRALPLKGQDAAVPPPLADPQAVQVIADTIAKTHSKRDEVFVALKKLGLAPAANGPLDRLAARAAVLFNDPPRLVL